MSSALTMTPMLILSLILLLITTVAAASSGHPPSGSDVLRVGYSAETLEAIFSNGTWKSDVAVRYGLFTPDQVTDLSLRISAITLSLGTFIVFWLSFANKNNITAFLIGFTLLGHSFAVFAAVVPFGRLVPSPNVYWTNLGSVSMLLTTSETFIWVLYLRFTAVVPIRSKILRWLALAWLVGESLSVAIVGIYWAYGALSQQFDKRANGAAAYSWLSIVQAASSLFLSGYFVVQFYLPRLRGLKSKALFVSLYSTGVVYLVIETLLQLAFLIGFRVQTTTAFYTGLSAFSTSLRLSIFLLFLFKIRDAGASSERVRSEQRKQDRAIRQAERQNIEAEAEVEMREGPWSSSSGAARSTTQGYYGNRHRADSKDAASAWVVPVGNTQPDTMQSKSELTTVAGTQREVPNSLSHRPGKEEIVRQGPVIPFIESETGANRLNNRSLQAQNQRLARASFIEEIDGAPSSAVVRNPVSASQGTSISQSHMMGWVDDDVSSSMPGNTSFGGDSAEIPPWMLPAENAPKPQTARRLFAGTSQAVGPSNGGVVPMAPLVIYAHRQDGHPNGNFSTNLRVDQSAVAGNTQTPSDSGGWTPPSGVSGTSDSSAAPSFAIDQGGAASSASQWLTQRSVTSSAMRAQGGRSSSRIGQPNAPEDRHDGQLSDSQRQQEQRPAYRQAGDVEQEDDHLFENVKFSDQNAW
ncbi:hypothetical protein DFJ73DRAFT_238431 [Zopfochytrium polystomum]|nr:hypothetical protein DFJ73DRAFT_238431 [Zopfochytrium polystomum]